MRNLIIDFYNKFTENKINYILKKLEGLNSINDVIVISDKEEELKLNSINSLTFILTSTPHLQSKHDISKTISKDLLEYDYIIFDACDENNELANLLSISQNFDILLNLTDIKVSDGTITATKQIYSNYLFREYSLNSKLVCSLIYNNKVKVDTTNAKIITKYEVKQLITSNKHAFKLISTKEKEKNNLVEAERVVLIGRGVRSEDISKAKKFAASINAEVGATRPVTYLGLLPLSIMIGSSNIKVSPKVLIALGVSGSAPLLTGIVNSSKIIAINNDKVAMIFNHSHFGALVDTKDFLNNALEYLEEKND